jgi:hypothetical protein
MLSVGYIADRDDIVGATKYSQKRATLPAQFHSAPIPAITLSPTPACGGTKNGFRNTLNLLTSLANRTNLRHARAMFRAAPAPADLITLTALLRPAAPIALRNGDSGDSSRKMIKSGDSSDSLKKTPQPGDSGDSSEKTPQPGDSGDGLEKYSIRVTVVTVWRKRHPPIAGATSPVVLAQRPAVQRSGFHEGGPG